MSIKDILITGRSAKLPGDWKGTDHKPPVEKQLPKARGNITHRTPGTMNKLEAEYAKHLEELKQRREIIWFGYEPISLRIGNGAWYTPDFCAIYANGEIRFFETKGFWREAARVRIKVAASLYWWVQFTAITKRAKKDGGGWIEEEMKDWGSHV